MTRGSRIVSRSSGFTLVELMTVMGLIALLTSLLLPVVGKVRAAAQSTTCLSNLRQMGTAWTMYTSESRGYLMHYVTRTPATPDAAYGAYWPGVVEQYGVRGESLLCPSAANPTDSAPGRGYGNASHAWSGKFATLGSTIRLNANTFRVGSFGFNRHLTAGGGFGQDSLANRITTVSCLSEVPVFFDCAYIDVIPPNFGPLNPVEAPPDLSGSQINAGSPDHWKILLARHGKGINVYFADGSARWERLEDLYQLTWRTDWAKYHLDLPSR